MKTNRTQQEILNRINEAKQRDAFGFELSEYVNALTFENAKPFLKDGVTVQEWIDSILDIDISQHAKGYMDFWLSKIEGERGISVCRATMHYTAWKWLLGHPDADTFPGSTDGGDGGWYQRDAYNYIKTQMDSGEWDRLTNEATSQTAGETA